MYQITEESMKQIVDGFNFLGQIEVKGFQNVSMMANAMALFQAGIQSIKKNKEEDNGE